MRLVFAMLTAATAVLAANMGENVHFNVADSGTETQTFQSVQEELKEDEVLKVQMYPMGRKNARPSPKTPVWLWINVRDESHQWVLPWQPGGGHPQQWLEVLLCDNHVSLELMAQTNSTTPLPMRWSVSTENVKLPLSTIKMKSTPADISYRRFRWSDKNTKAVDLTVSVVVGEEVCASLAVARRCVTHPHHLTDSHLLQRILFSRSVNFTVARDDAPDGFWLYLIPEADITKCPLTAHRGSDRLPQPAKTIEVRAQTRAFLLGSTTPSPLADFELPRGDGAQLASGAGVWAEYSAGSDAECQGQLEQCRMSCPSA